MVITLRRFLGFRGARRTQYATAGRARGIRRGKLCTDARHLRANALERFVVPAVLVPGRKLLAHALERAAIALIERIGRRIELADDRQRRLFDPRGILRRELD